MLAIICHRQKSNEMKVFFLLELIGIISGIMAVIGVVLNNYKMKVCFIVWLMSNGLSAYCHYDVALSSLFWRDLVFLGLAVHGWLEWRK